MIASDMRFDRNKHGKKNNRQPPLDETECHFHNARPGMILL